MLVSRCLSSAVAEMTAATNKAPSDPSLAWIRGVRVLAFCFLLSAASGASASSAVAAAPGITPAADSPTSWRLRPLAALANQGGVRLPPVSGLGGGSASFSVGGSGRLEEDFDPRGSFVSASWLLWLVADAASVTSPYEYCAPLPLRRRAAEFSINGVGVGFGCACGGAPRISEMYCRCGEVMAGLPLSSACWPSWAEAEDFPSVFNPPADYKVMPALRGSSGGAPAARGEWRCGLVPQGPVCYFLSYWGALYHCSVAI